MARRTPSLQERSQVHNYWGVYDTAEDLPNAINNALPTEKFVLEEGDTAYADGVQYVCTDPGNAVSGDAVWEANGGGGGSSDILFRWNQTDLTQFGSTIVWNDGDTDCTVTVEPASTYGTGGVSPAIRFASSSGVPAAFYIPFTGTFNGRCIIEIQVRESTTGCGLLMVNASNGLAGASGYATMFIYTQDANAVIGGYVAAGAFSTGGFNSDAVTFNIINVNERPYIQIQSDVVTPVVGDVTQEGWVLPTSITGIPEGAYKFTFTDDATLNWNGEDLDGLGIGFAIIPPGGAPCNIDISSIIVRKHPQDQSAGGGGGGGGGGGNLDEVINATPPDNDVVIPAGNPVILNSPNGQLLLLDPDFDYSILTGAEVGVNTRGTSDMTNSGPVTVNTGGATGGGDSGDIYIGTGGSLAGNTGTATLASGDADNNSGTVTISTGDVVTGNAGNVVIRAGSPSDPGGLAGNIQVTAGQNDDGTRGFIFMLASIVGSSTDEEVSGACTYTQPLYFSTTGSLADGAIYMVDSNPNGQLTAVAGAIAIQQGSNPTVYQNFDGGTQWNILMAEGYFAPTAIQVVTTATDTIDPNTSIVFVDHAAARTDLTLPATTRRFGFMIVKRATSGGFGIRLIPASGSDAIQGLSAGTNFDIPGSTVNASTTTTRPAFYVTSSAANVVDVM